MRTDPHTFDLPVKKIRDGYYSDQYFNFTKAIFEQGTHETPLVTMQVFQKKHAVVAGIDEAIAVLKLCSGKAGPSEYGPASGGRFYAQPTWVDGWDELAVWALNEGDRVQPYEPVMHIEGPYNLFAHLETVYLGVLARRTMVATNVSEVIDSANGKPIYYFPARHDHWKVQTGDGFAAKAAGVAGVSTDAQASWWGGRGMGTVPHALIAAFGGSTTAAAAAFSRKYGHDMNVSVLVDFENDCARTAVEVADHLKELGLPLWGVRLDTSESLVDYGLIHKQGQYKPTGVNEHLVEHVRQTLDEHGHQDVKIIVSGGFNVDKIVRFEGSGIPVDAYGVGASLIHGDFAYTADIVRVNEQPCAKVGRSYAHNPRLELVS